MRGLSAVPVSWSNFDAGVHLFTATCDLTQDLSLFPELEVALDYWERKRSGHMMPGRQDIDPVEMHDFLSRVMLLDVVHKPVRFRYRVCGTGVCHVHHGDMTGMWVDNLQPGPYGGMLHEQYFDVVRTRRPAMYLNAFDSHDCYRAYARLVMPMSRNHDSVDMIMSVDSIAQDKAEMMALLGHLQRRAGIEPGRPSLYGRTERRRSVAYGE